MGTASSVFSHRAALKPKTFCLFWGWAGGRIESSLSQIVTRTVHVGAVAFNARRNK